jgi:hypothetical protein
MTEFLIGGRGTGKSTEAVRWVRGAGNRYLVVADSMRAANLLRTDQASSDRLGVSRLHPEKVIPWTSLTHGRHMGQTIELAVDDLDAMLHQIFRSPVGFVTATGSLHGLPESVANLIQLGGPS